MKFSMNEVLTALRANGLHDEVAAVGIVLQQRAELLEALKELLDREWQDDEGDYTLEIARNKSRSAIANAEK